MQKNCLKIRYLYLFMYFGQMAVVKFHLWHPKRIHYMNTTCSVGMYIRYMTEWIRKLSKGVLYVSHSLLTNTHTSIRVDHIYFRFSPCIQSRIAKYIRQFVLVDSVIVKTRVLFHWLFFIYGMKSLTVVDTDHKANLNLINTCYYVNMACLLLPLSQLDWLIWPTPIFFKPTPTRFDTRFFVSI